MQHPKFWPAHSARFPNLLAASLPESAPLVLGSFGDKDPGGHAALWEMVLAYLKAHPSAWQACDGRKAVLPRLWAFLRWV